MATKTAKEKKNIEVLLVSCTLNGVPEKGLLKSRNLGTVDFIWPRTGVAKKTASREFVFNRGKADFTGEEWGKRVLFREEIEDHTAVAVSISEPVSVQKVRQFLRLTAKLALKEGADIVEGLIVGYGDIASAPVDALAAMVGSTTAPKTIVQGILDVNELPADGEEMLVEVPLYRAKLTKKRVGTLTLLFRG